MEKQGITDDYLMDKLNSLITASDLNVRDKGLDKAFKLKGSYAPEKKDIEQTINEDVIVDRLSRGRHLLKNLEDIEI